MAASIVRPPWLAHVGVVLLAVIASVLAAVLAAVVIGVGVASGAYACVRDYSEGQTIAPGSWRGSLLCTAGPDGPAQRDWLFAAVLFTAPAAALGVLASWFRRRSRRGLELGLIVVLAVPTLLLVAVRVLPAG